jgi:hypothetical protein
MRRHYNGNSISDVSFNITQLSQISALQNPKKCSQSNVLFCLEQKLTQDRANAIWLMILYGICIGGVFYAVAKAARGKVGASKTFAVWLLSGLFALSPIAANAQTAIGNATKVVRQVQGTLANNVRVLKTQDDVVQNEVIKTAADSASELVFRDDTTLTIGPNAEVTLDTFVFDPGPTKGKVIINQTIGTIRFVSGKLAKQVYEIRTPTATIGIRGTVFTVTVAANGATTVSVTQGAVAVTNAAGVS